MLGFKCRTLLLAGAVALTATAFPASSADAGWGYGYGYGYGYRPAVSPVRVYRPAYRYAAPRYVAPVRRAYRPIVPVAPLRVTPYQAGYGYYPSYGGYRSGFGNYGIGNYGTGVQIGVGPIGYFGY